METITPAPVCPAWVLSFLDENYPRSVVAKVNLIRTARLLEKSMTDFMEPYGLTCAQCEILFLLRCHGRERGLTLTQLGEWQGVTKANMTGMVDRLEREGFVLREKDPQDRRLTNVTITPQALALVNQLEPTLQAHVGAVFHCLDEDEQETLIRLLSRLRQSLGDQEALA
ncbi:MarR family winged helix-turn-helix transcriptional regulator [Candidatus Cyanaurora vandensis]|uniref:MarR family winged helix-turn-helix transcriptional regulator n=1 Tax=Candidatus Cyanaurora vandensis TaxID=2714958 RepID=UPI00257F448B|nr:MarR family transcriptional regulator [Candidatus Cyanaurora vandensis]